MATNSHSGSGDELTNLRLEVAVDLRADYILDLLNDSLDRQSWWEFWASNPSEDEDEVGLPVLPTKPGAFVRGWIRAYELATNTLRNRVDEWIDSGRRKDGSEAPMERSYLRAEKTFVEASLYLQRSPFEVLFPDIRREPHAFPILQFRSPSADDGIEHHDSQWKARRVIAVILCSELRLRIAHCRFAKCARPYFLLDPKPRKQVYRHGLFCTPAHSRAATASLRMSNRREAFDRKLIEWAAACVFKGQKGFRPACVWDKSFRRHLADRVNRRIGQFGAHTRDQITINWVTRHRLEIQAKAEEMTHATRQD